MFIPLLYRRYIFIRWNIHAYIYDYTCDCIDFAWIVAFRIMCARVCKWFFCVKSIRSKYLWHGHLLFTLSNWNYICIFVLYFPLFFARYKIYGGAHTWIVLFSAQHKAVLSDAQQQMLSLILIKYIASFSCPHRNHYPISSTQIGLVDSGNLTICKWFVAIKVWATMD